eukprot:CAMPEP_0176416270 /NCGR_PEP_ID=MMETSP0127-20121128/6257_1 /TAXON_ID=938130 /ORGANISM="Platyophrya macrostoma, Strain WH" /LENGTH=276 /DNA_ID=CAMNT_0017796335 /DNA_START=31 /DNA_END=861 /DNA_ORIENTATION=-
MINFATIKNAIFKPLLPVLKIQGPITSELTSKVARSLKNINPKRSKALAVVINSPGGSAAQSELICDKLKHFLYTFAEDIAASGGYYILCIGDKVYVDPSSIVGSIGVVAFTTFVKKAAEDQKVKIRNVASREDLLSYKFNPFREDISDGEKQMLHDMLKRTHQDFIDHVETHRSKKITLDQQKRNEVVYNADVFLGSKCVELGLADKLGNYESVLFREFPDAKIVNVTSKTTAEKYRDAFQTSTQFLKSEDNLLTMTPEQQIKELVSRYTESLKK